MYSLDPFIMARSPIVIKPSNNSRQPKKRTYRRLQDFIRNLARSVSESESEEDGGDDNKKVIRISMSSKELLTTLIRDLINKVIGLCQSRMLELNAKTLKLVELKSVLKKVIIGKKLSSDAFEKGEYNLTADRTTLIVRHCFIRHQLEASGQLGKTISRDISRYLAGVIETILKRLIILASSKSIQSKSSTNITLKSTI
ncbi:hypothetical protein PPL_05818 [Heterostelium album PN500]|uniref:Uncharacterized protein n=1 Tax=Heterostelium pallidum (strain ATCC 26659 / Pp 5 / PN500) TaxID=670386 RepID=D3BBF2_HETP5|nr:hypothetical protein PPL_05818 [Heterostelium album PN500]EFA80985.1 hypothetical protein PPL_05818 [Heterostelium album PN500]|eukprot:XP_020433103.1 hypothetical protein PPL_05818 [Heterostelium album PN500]